MDFITSDLHFNHTNIIKYCNRPFKDAKEQDKTIIENWNKVVTPDDIVYLLGDIGFGDINYLENCIKQLNGIIHLGIGNHDHHYIRDYQRIFSGRTFQIKEVKYNEFRFVLCHYPLLSWNAAFHGTLHCFGHVHGQMEHPGNAIDVGVDSNNFFPITFDQCLEKLNQKNGCIDKIKENKKKIVSDMKSDYLKEKK